MKKIYQKPSMKVVELKHHTRLLTGSGYGDEIAQAGSMHMSNQDPWMQG